MQRGIGTSLDANFRQKNCEQRNAEKNSKQQNNKKYHHPPHPIVPNLLPIPNNRTPRPPLHHGHWTLTHGPVVNDNHCQPNTTTAMTTTNNFNNALFHLFHFTNPLRNSHKNDVNLTNNLTSSMDFGGTIFYRLLCGCPHKQHFLPRIPSSLG